MTIKPRSVLVNSVVLLACGLVFAISDDDEKCASVKDCQCTLSNGSVINLKPISSKTNYPRFPFLQGTNETSNNSTVLIFYDPCNTFNLEFAEGQFCSNALGCLVNPSLDGSNVTAKVLASSSSKLKFSPTSIVYISSESTLTVNLHCPNQSSHNPSILVKDANTLDVELNLTTECACADGCKSESPDKPSKKGLSTGSILLIVAFTLVLAYLFCGIIWNGVCQGATGAEMIPNLSFWKDFPSLILEGANYSVSCCKTRSSYDQV